MTSEVRVADISVVIWCHLFLLSCRHNRRIYVIGCAVCAGAITYCSISRLCFGNSSGRKSMLGGRISLLWKQGIAKMASDLIRAGSSQRRGGRFDLFCFSAVG